MVVAVDVHFRSIILIRLYYRRAKRLFLLFHEPAQHRGKSRSDGQIPADHETNVVVQHHALGECVDDCCDQDQDQEQDQDTDRGHATTYPSPGRS